MQKSTQKTTPKRSSVMLIQGFAAPKASVWPLQRALQKRGFQVYVADLPWLNMARIDVACQALAASIEQVRRVDMRPLNLVGTSLGGLLGLHHIQCGGGAGHVRNLIGVGTPFYGISWRKRLGRFGLRLETAMGAFAPTVLELRPNGPFLAELHQKPLPKSVNVYSLFSPEDPITPAQSAQLRGAHWVPIQGMPKFAAHQWLALSSEVSKHVVDILDTAAADDEAGILGGDMDMDSDIGLGSAALQK